MNNQKQSASTKNSKTQGVPDMPLGLGMALMQTLPANNFYASLSNGEKTKVISYIQASTSGDDAKARIRTAVESLSNADKGFFI